MFHIVLDRPEIPQNTGNIARTCAATGCVLHLVRPLGFDISDRALKRAGLDYWKFLDVRVHDTLEEAIKELAPVYFFSTKAKRRYTDVSYPAGSCLVFGRETRGLDEELLKANEKSCVRIPMIEGRRSLNLSNSVAIAVYEGLRQNDFKGLAAEGALHRLSWDM